MRRPVLRVWTTRGGRCRQNMLRGGRRQHRTAGRRVNDEHRKTPEKDIAPVGAVDIDSRQQQPRLAVEFGICSCFKFDRTVAWGATAGIGTVERRHGSTVKVKAAMAWHNTNQSMHRWQTISALGSWLSERDPWTTKEQTIMNLLSLFKKVRFVLAICKI